MRDNATTFGAQADHYAAARPSYPGALFDWIASEAPGSGLAWDVGTGSGQSALALADRFERVHATDLDPAQIAAAPSRGNVAYAASPAHKSGLPTGSADAVTVATALHWFDVERFWPEVRRTARPGGVFAAWTYHRVEADAATQRLLLDPVLALIEPYWSDGNRLSWRGYPPAEVAFPFEPIGAPDFACELDWRPADLAAFVRSWSAHARASADGLAAELARAERAALDALPDRPGRVTLPLALLAGRIG